MTKLDKIDCHPSHPDHPLWHKRMTLYKCNGCDQLGFGLCYRCKNGNCNFHLHKECARSASDTHLHHPFYPKHVLLFRCYDKPRQVRSCKACGDGVSGFRYKAWHQKAHRSSNPFWLIYQHCNQKALHPSCAGLPPSLHGDGGLVLKLNKNKKGTGTCRICDNETYSRGVKGWAYISGCGKFSYHVSCVKRWMEDVWESKSLNKSQRWKRMAAKIGMGAARIALELVVDAILGFPPTALRVVMSYLFSGEN